jgi:phage/plasmid primase-like uncharacterized protein
MKLGILCGGGPAPGIDSVISAATIEANNSGWEVVGILDGNRQEVAEALTSAFPQYQFIVIPTDDVRTKPARPARERSGEAVTHTRTSNSHMVDDRVYQPVGDHLEHRMNLQPRIR